MNSWGSSMQNGSLILSQTAGQSSNTEVFHNSNYLRQGFQQSSTIQLDEDIIEIALFPNPNNGSFSFSVIKGYEEALFKITDIKGKEIYPLSKMSSPQQSVTINNISQGMYFLIVSDPKGNREMKKFIVN